MSQYFYSIGENELAEGFDAFYDNFPEDTREIEKCTRNLDLVYPFSIPKSLFNLIVECSQYQQSATERLDKFKSSIVLSYQRKSEDVLSKVATKTTVMTLPFLLIMVFLALLWPSFTNYMNNI